MTGQRGNEAALIIGFSIQGLAVARALASNGIRVYAVERPHRTAVMRTRRAKIFHRDSLVGPELVRTLLDVRQEIPEERVVLFAASDNTVTVLAREWEQLSDHYILSWADCRHDIARIIQKGQLPALCDATGTRYPKTVVIADVSEVDACIERLSFPILVKPNKPASSFKACLIRTEAEMRAFVRRETVNLPLVTQEWIDGPDSSLYFYSCIVDKGNELYGLTGRKVRASPPGLGRATVIQTFEDEGVREAARTFLRNLNISGPASMEFKRDSEGRYWFIEANVGRTEFCIDLMIQAGFNVPFMEFELALSRPVPLPTELRESIWFDTEKEPLCYAALCARQLTFRPFGKHLVFPFYGHGEPALVLWSLIDTARTFAQRARRKVYSLAARPLQVRDAVSKTPT